MGLGKKGEITKGQEETSEVHRYIHRLKCGDSFHGMYMSKYINLYNLSMYSPFYDN